MRKISYADRIQEKIEIIAMLHEEARGLAALKALLTTKFKAHINYGPCYLLVENLREQTYNEAVLQTQQLLTSLLPPEEPDSMAAD